MTAATLSRGIESTVARVILFSITSPRLAVRELLAAKDVVGASWIISTLAILVSSFSPSFYEWLRFFDLMKPLESTYIAFKLSLWLSMTWDLVGAALLAVLIPLIVLIWVYVFGFRAKSGLVWVAMVVSLAMSIIMEPVFGFVTYLFKIPDDNFISWFLLTVQLAISLFLCGLYYSEALSIRLGKALILNLAAFGMVVVSLSLVAIATITLVGIDVTGSAP